MSAPVAPASVPFIAPSIAPSFTNVAAYRFVAVADPSGWIEALQARGDALGLKGTIIVADEGINLFLAGDAAAIDAFLHWLAIDPLFADRSGRPALVDLAVKRSVSAAIPFRRLRTRRRPEIVTMRVPSVRPDEERAPTVAPERLAAWLAQGRDDDGRPVVLLDTRNAFEVDHGRFDGALHLDLERFDAFPAAVAALRPALDDATVVTYCTGGIRCEKAALYMRRVGFERVLQLDGGILAYFERVGSDHWSGDCFVFDARRTVGADLGADFGADFGADYGNASSATRPATPGVPVR